MYFIFFFFFLDIACHTLQPTALAEIQAAESVQGISDQHVQMDFITTSPHAFTF